MLAVSATDCFLKDLNVQCEKRSLTFDTLVLAGLTLALQVA